MGVQWLLTRVISPQLLTLMLNFWPPRQPLNL
jgi:hypothetical protein